MEDDSRVDLKPQPLDGQEGLELGFPVLFLPAKDLHGGLIGDSAEVPVLV